jgi:hypothetical protein
LERVGRLPENIREAAGDRQFVKRVDPVGAEIVGLRVRVYVRLLVRVLRPHALIDRNEVGLHVRRVIRRAGEVRGTTVDGKDVTRHIIPGTHPREELGIALGYRSELRVPVFARRGDVGNSDVVDHPPFVPATLVVDDEQRRDVGEHIVERARVVRGSSTTTRTAPTVGNPQFAPVTLSCTWSFTPGKMAVNTFGSKPVVSSR